MSISRLREQLQSAGQRDRKVNRWLGVAFVILIIGIAAKQPPLLGLGLLLALAALVADAWWRFGLRGLQFERTLGTTHARFGEEIDLTIMIENAKPLPLIWLEIADQVPSALPVIGVDIEKGDSPNRGVMRVRMPVRAYERVRRHYRVVCQTRGFYRFGDTTLRTGDPFGFIVRRQKFVTPVNLVVYPDVKALPVLGLPSELPIGEARPRQPLFDDPFSVDGIRPYQPGDPPRQISWRATARTGEIQSKRYERNATTAAWIFLDCNTFEHFWEGFDSDLLEHTISVAASVSANLIQRGKPVGLIANAPPSGQARHLRINASANRGQIDHLLEGMAMLVGGTGVRMEDVLMRDAHRLPHGATVIVVSPALTAGLQDGLFALARRGVRPVVLCCGTAPELDRHLAGKIVFYQVGKEGSDGLQPQPLAS